jgi:hypothetical protein
MTGALGLPYLGGCPLKPARRVGVRTHDKEGREIGLFLTGG